MTISRNGCVRSTAVSSGDSSWASLASTGRVGVLRRLDRAAQDAVVLALRLAEAREDPLEEQLSFGEHQLDVDARPDLDPGVVLPGRDRVGPGVDLERPRAGLVRRHPGAVAVDRVPVDHRLRMQADRRASDARGVDQHHLGAEEIVALPEHRRRDRERFADRGFRRQSAVVDEGHHVDHRDASDHGSTQPLTW